VLNAKLCIGTAKKMAINSGTINTKYTTTTVTTTTVKYHHALWPNFLPLKRWMR
jgi:hypothetical protein